jgi:hypothetical protein
MQEARKWLPATRDRMELRRHALKLRYWPNPSTSDASGSVLDLDWEWIRGLPGMRIGELRIHDTIGGHNNLRIIFFVADRAPHGGELPCIWILSVFQKKRNDLTAAQLANFKARRTIILERFYGS